MDHPKSVFIPIPGWVEFETHKAWAFLPDYGDFDAIQFIPKSQSIPEWNCDTGAGSTTLMIKGWLVDSNKLYQVGG